MFQNHTSVFFCDYVRCLWLLKSTPPSQHISPFQQLFATLSQNLPLPPRIYYPFKHLYAMLPESTPPPTIYPPFFHYYMWRSPNPPPPPRTYPHSFPQLYAALPKSTPLSKYIPPSFPLLYATFPESTPSGWFHQRWIYMHIHEKLARYRYTFKIRYNCTHCNKVKHYSVGVIWVWLTPFSKRFLSHFL